MERHRAEKLFKKLMPAMRHNLWLGQYSVSVEWGPIKLDYVPTSTSICTMACETDMAYKKIKLFIDHNQFEDTPEGHHKFAEDLRHEFLHGVHAEISFVAGSLDMIEMSDDTRKIIRREWVNGVENLVSRLENIFDGLGITPQDLADPQICKVMQRQRDERRKDRKQ